MRKLSGVLLVASAAVAACSRSSPESAGSGSATATTSIDSSELRVANGTASATTGTPCPRTGLWAVCSVEKRLEQSGFVVKPVGGIASRRAGFSVAPNVYRLGRSRLEVFIYPNEAALSADVAKMDTASAAPRGAVNPWGMPPTFVRSGNLAAVLLTDNATQAERLTLALTAGAPQR
jgi:hypothetical protein